MSSCLRVSDSLCDLGGSRFALLLDDIREPSAVPMVIEKLNATLMGPSRPIHRVRWVTNVGASLLPVAGTPVSEVWRDTEMALEKAIASGSGGYEISPMVTGKAAMERFELSKDLYKAYRNKQFDICYQPIVDLATNRPSGVEGLLRWQHPQRGCLSPDVFLPLLEESGLIVPVGEELLKLSCHMARELVTAGHADFRICLNISARQLLDGGFLLSVLDALYEANLDAPFLQLEFSEPLLTQHRDLLHRLLPELNSAGVRLAVDHFGTGNAPLAELVRLPINLIKLDHTLVGELLADPGTQAVASAVVALANSTDITIAAVGVEQQQQATALGRLGCHEAQGHYYYKTLTADEISATLNA